MNEEEARQAYFEFKVIEEQIKQLQHQIKHIDAQIAEFENASASIDELKGKSGEDSFVPLSSGIYAKAKLGDSEKFVVSVGAGIAVEKSGAETKDMIDKNLEEIKQYREQMLKGLQLLGSRAEEIEKMVAEAESSKEQ